MASASNKAYGYSPEDYEPEDFYSEDDESSDDEYFDEGFFESDDESDSDEGMSIEASDDEAFDESDDESYLESDDEAFYEASDDEPMREDRDDEAFESDDEMTLDGAVGMRERTRRAQALARINSAKRAQEHRRLAMAQQRVASQGAAKLRRDLDSRLRSITTKPVRIGRVSRLRGKGIVTLTTRGGRPIRVKINPVLASQDSVNLLTRQLNTNSANQAKALAAQSSAIEKLKSAQQAAVKSLTAEQTKFTKNLTNRIAAADAKLDKRISTEINSRRKMDAVQNMKTQRALRKQQRNSLLNSVMIGSSLPFWAAYADRSSPFAKNNLILTGALAAGLFGDEVIDRFLSDGGKRKGIGRTAQLWSLAAPVVVNGLVYWYFQDKQHERFVTGVTTRAFTLNNVIEIDLKDKIASDYFDEFKKIGEIPVVASLVNAGGTNATGLTAKISSDGKLQVTLVGDTNLANGNPVIAWAVDTQKDS